MMGTYAQIVNTTVANIVICDAAFAAAAGLVEIDNVSPQPGIGWTFVADVWTPLAIDPNQANEAVIATAIENHLLQLETWLAANPNGATLTAAQNAIVARMLVGIGRLLLGLTQTVGQGT